MRFRVAVGVEQEAEAMKLFILGAIVAWFLFGIAGAVLLGQQDVEIRTIATGPVAFWHGLDKPVS
jgi:hypothetical protein